jgi:hypothetical protein
MSMKVRATLVKNDGTIVMKFPIEKTKDGKFVYATQKNLEQLFYALDDFSCVIFGLEAEHTSSVATFIDAVQSNKMIDVCRWLRSQFNLDLSAAVELMKEYFKWPGQRTLVQREIGLNRILRDMQTGVIKRRV